MKTISCFLLVLAFGLLPATLGAQSSARNHNEPVNYHAEFAELMHGVAATKPELVSSPSVNRFQAFVHYRKVMKGRAKDFLANYKTMMATVPAHRQCGVQQPDEQQHGFYKTACQK